MAPVQRGSAFSPKGGPKLWFVARVVCPSRLARTEPAVNSPGGERSYERDGTTTKLP